MEIVINNFNRTRIDAKIIKKIASYFKKKKMVVSLSFVPRDKIRKLNREYRHKDKATDVLSFFMGEGRFLGDVIISTDVARKNAKEFKCTLREEIARLATHGVLHLLGFGHGKRMFDLQDKIVGGVLNA